jgi:hypothetical protein
MYLARWAVWRGLNAQEFGLEMAEPLKCSKWILNAGLVQNQVNLKHKIQLKSWNIMVCLIKHFKIFMSKYLL